jgi:hypothetical protein
MKTKDPITQEITLLRRHLIKRSIQHKLFSLGAVGRLAKEQTKGKKK